MSDQFLTRDEQDETNLKKNALNDLKSFKFLLKQGQARKEKFIFALILMLISSLVAIYSSRAMGHLVEDGLLKKAFDESYFWAILIVVCEVSSLALQWCGRRILIINSSATILDIRKKLFAHIQKLPLGFYDKQPQGRIITRITHDVEGVEEFFTSTIGRFVNAIFMAIISGTAMCITDLRLGLILVASMLPAVALVYLTKNKVRVVNRRMSKLSSEINSKLNEYLSGIDVIRSYGLENWSHQNFDATVNDHRRAQLNANFLYSWTRPLTAFFCTLPLVGLVFFGGKEVLAGTMSVGIFVAFIRYCEKFFSPIMMLAREIHVIQQAFTSSERVHSFFSHDEEEVVLGEDGEISEFDIKGNIEFKKTWMAYDSDNWVLKDLNFNIKSGEKIGLVGSTGCGKTTTVSLLARLYDFQKGSIEIDGVSIRDFNRRFLRSSIGFVSQDPIIFSASLRENLCAGKIATDENIINCCKETGFYKVMEESAMTLDSTILEGGENLSIGEKQLLSLTRVLLGNPKILVLDEATANIDPNYEKVIHQAIVTIMEGKTCLIIAHRLDTVMSCDRLLVFEKGRLAESGTPRELLASDGLFAGLQKASEL
ncbi:ABC transporter ATP-binding protein [Halobacteriovorax sp. JY17]|uniref:ABC transporter ATP-binding protein n=1 Tax=Halobacteriovorax sp. JY17 TaxID=2014617 RepID=UPI0025BB75CF|nr:ABC transporter ATP-binding protein [Halobacteriovorax sp. JY17]